MQMFSTDPAILLVDDDPAVLHVMEAFTTSFGFGVQCATDGQDAIDLLATEHFDIVITDAVMPKISGLELLAHIQRHNPQTRVIVVTGYNDHVSYTDVIQAGASDFIAKPFSRDEFEAKLNRVIREQQTVEELERLSICDGLTGLYNRRRFDSRMWEEAHRAHRQRYCLYLAMMDVDYFKEYNDTYGHQAGDNVLQSIGRLLVHATRVNVDTCYRYGGDEFAVIIPQTSNEQVVRIAERIVAAYADLGFGWTGLSVGLALFERKPGQPWSEDIADTVAQADGAMYDAKADGDRQIVWHGD